MKKEVKNSEELDDIKNEILDRLEINLGKKNIKVDRSKLIVL